MSARSDSVRCPVRAVAMRRPDAVLLRDDTGEVTFGAADAILDRIGAQLRGEGLEIGQRVGLLGEADRHYVLTLLALWRMGLVACPFNLRRPDGWLATYARELNIQVVLTGTEAESRDLPLTRLRLESVVGDAPRRTNIGHGEEPHMATAGHALIVATSGTTGTPKAAVLTYGNLFYNAEGSNQNIPLSPGDDWALSLPLYHVGGIGIIMRCVLAEACIRLTKHGVHEQATHLSLVPTQLYRMLGTENIPSRGRLKAILLGGAPASAALLAEAHRRSLPIHLSYGLTEMGSQVATTPPGADLETLSTAGRVLPHRELRISEEGEILVRGKTLFAGYAQAGHLSAPLDDEGWFHTRDRGHVDEHGRLHVTGRIDNLFISGGENIQPEEVEEALLRIEGIEAAIVVPVDDEEFGRRPFAFVQSKTQRPDEQQIRQQLRARLPGYMLPVGVSALPPGFAGEMKPDRRALQAEAARRWKGR